jgi:hypothetical protein
MFGFHGYERRRARENFRAPRIDGCPFSTPIFIAIP